jgi:hypothetical protein
MITGTSGRSALASGSKTAHPRHVDVRQNQNQRLVACISDVLKCGGSGLRKFHCEAVGAEVASELLAKKHLDVGLVVNDENEKAHAGCLPLFLAS